MPRPRLSTRPSAVSSSIARRTVARLTPSSSHNERSEGSRSPGAQRAALDLLRDLPVDPVVERLGGLADAACAARLFQRCAPHVKPLVCFGLSWYVPVHGVPGHRPVGRRPRAARAPWPTRSRPPTGSRRRPSCSRGGVERIVATGNGAAYYVAHALWLASLEGEPPGPPIVAVPCGIVGARRGSAGSRATPCSRCPRRASSATWSRSRRRAAGRPCVAITASADSSLAAAADATRRAARRVAARGDAHAGARGRVRLRAGAVGGADGRRRARAALAGAPDAGARAVAEAEAWAAAGLRARPRRRAAVAAGGGPAWAAALELALMLKEIARIPAEGVETREGATSAMFGLGPRAPDGRRWTRRATRTATRRCACARPPARRRCGSRPSPARTRGSPRSRRCPPRPRWPPGWRCAPAHDVDHRAWDGRLLRDRAERDVSRSGWAWSAAGASSGRPT